MSDTSVYLLETYRFTKQSARFSPSNPDTFPDFFPDKYGRNGPWTPPRLAATWMPQRLIGDVWPDNDFPGAGPPANLTPVFSARAVEGLRAFLEPNGELLPVITPKRSYLAYNLTTVVDALDAEATDASWILPMVSTVKHFEFRPKILDGLTIFKIPQTPVEIYVTEPFVRRVRELGLNGMWITKLWPLPAGETWQTAWNAELSKMKTAYAQPQPKVVVTKPKVPARAAKILDLRKDIPAIEKLLENLVKWIGRQQKEWITKGETLSAIGLEFSGWDMDDGPMLMCNIDTREVPGHDGQWTHFNQMSLKLPTWGTLARLTDYTAGPIVLIDVQGKQHAIAKDGDLKLAWFGEAVVAAVKEAKTNAVFDGLPSKTKCEVGFEDPEEGFFWPGSKNPPFRVP